MLLFITRTSGRNPGAFRKKQRSLGNRTSFPIALGVFTEHVYDFNCPLQVSKAGLPTASLKSTQPDAVSTPYTH